MRAPSRQWVALAAVVVVVGGGGAAGWNHWHDGTSRPKPVVRAAPPTIADAHEVAAALAKLPQNPQDLVAADVRSVVGPQVGGALPPGATVSADEASWHPDGLDGGTITVTVSAPGATPSTYTAIMIKEPSGWKVVGTVPMAAGGGSAPAVKGAAPAANIPGASAATPEPTPEPTVKPKKHHKAKQPTAGPGSAQ